MRLIPCPPQGMDLEELVLESEEDVVDDDDYEEEEDGGELDEDNSEGCGVTNLHSTRRSGIDPCPWTTGRGSTVMKVPGPSR